MLFKSLDAKIKAMDIYKKVPKNLTEATYTGAMVSIISIIIVVVLFLSEVKLFLNHKILTDIEVSQQNPYDTTQLNMQIFLPNLPCQAVRLRSSNFDYQKENQIKYEDYNPKDDKYTLLPQQSSLSIEQVKLLFVQKIGYQTPGNVMIYPYSEFNEPAVRALVQEQQIKIDLAHQINYLNFGKMETISQIKSQFDKQNQLETLNGYEQPHKGLLVNLFKKNEIKNIYYEYFINIANSQFIDIKDEYYHSYEYTVNTQNFIYPDGSMIDFKYEFSPLLMTYIQQNQPFTSFVVQIFAIIGGIFTVAGLIESILHSGVQKMLKKNEMGKLR